MAADREHYPTAGPLRPGGGRRHPRKLRPAPLAAAVVALALATAAPAAAQPRVLIIPTSGTLKGRLAGTPARIDKVLAEVAVDSGGEPLTAKVSKAEIAAIIGCADDESTECFEESATTLGVDRIVFARIESRPDGTATLSLTYFQTGQPVRRDQVELTARDPDGAAEQARAPAAELAREPVVAPPTPPEPPPPPPPPAPGFSFGRVRGWTWGVAGGGVVLLGMSALFFSLAGDKQDQVDAAPTDTLDDIHHLQDLEASGRRLNLLGNLSLVAGGAAVITGAVLIWRQGRAPAAERPPSTVTLAPSAGGATLVWSGRF